MHESVLCRSRTESQEHMHSIKRMRLSAWRLWLVGRLWLWRPCALSSSGWVALEEPDGGRGLRDCCCPGGGPAAWSRRGAGLVWARAAGLGRARRDWRLRIAARLAAGLARARAAGAPGWCGGVSPGAASRGPGGRRVALPPQRARRRGARRRRRARARRPRLLPHSASPSRPE